MKTKIFLLCSLIFLIFIGCKQKSNSAKSNYQEEAMLENGFNPVTGVGVLDKIIFRMKDIPVATNETLGHPQEESDNQPRKVTLDAFSIAETEVTQELYQAVMGKNPSQCRDLIEGEETDKKPVERVSWLEAVAFCNRLTQMMPGLGDDCCVYYSDRALTDIYTEEDAASNYEVFANWSRKGFRLPTSSEWEWAARGGIKDAIWAGTSDEKEVEDYAWIDKNSDSTNHEIAKKLPNAYGLYDMSGNVFEWCWDWYEDPISTKPQTNPRGPMDGKKGGYQKIMRGGAAGMEFSDATVLHIAYSSPAHHHWVTGSRLARNK